MATKIMPLNLRTISPTQSAILKSRSAAARIGHFVVWSALPTHVGVTLKRNVEAPAKVIDYTLAPDAETAEAQVPEAMKMKKARLSTAEGLNRQPMSR